MKTNLNQFIESVAESITRQGYDTPYLVQALPIAGFIVSVPTAVVSGAMTVAKVSQAVFLKVKGDLPFFRSPEEKERKIIQYPLEDAIDLGIIFVNSMLNICTLGVLNVIFVNQFIKHIHSEIDKEFESAYLKPIERDSRQY